MIAAIVANGDLGEVKKIRTLLPAFDFVVCCDGGLRHLEKLDLKPDVIVGDFDSVDPSLLDDYYTQGISIKTYPAEKDKTDTELAAQTVIEAGADKVIILGGIGSRWDHSYANVMILVKLAKQGIDAEIMHSHNRIVVSNKELYLSGIPGQFVSLLPLGENVFINETKGLKYKIKNRELPLDAPYGISNVLLETKAEITIASGWLMGIIAED